MWYMKSYLIAVISLFLWGSLKGQTCTNCMKADEDLQKGKAFYNSYAPGEPTPALLDSSEYYLTKAIACFKEQDDLAKWLGGYTYLRFVYAHRSNKIEVANLFDRIFDQLWRPPMNNAEWARLATIYMHKGFNAKELGDYHTAKLSYEKSREIFEEQQTSSFYLATYVYKPLSITYWYLGDDQLAEFYAKRVLQEAQRIQDNSFTAQSFNNLALIYQTNNDYELAQETYESGIQLTNLPANDLALLKTNLGGMLVKNEEATVAIPHLNQAISLYEDADLKKETVVPHRMLGLAHMLINEFTLAKVNLHAARDIAIREETFPTLYCPDFALIHSNLAYLYLKQNRYQKALSIYQKALHYLIPDLDSSDIQQQPQPELFYPEPLILEVLEAKGNAFHKLYKISNAPSDLVQAFHCYQLCAKMEEVLQLSYDNEAAKLDLMAKSPERTETALEIAYKLYLLTKDAPASSMNISTKTDYLSEAFNLSESSKSSLLLASLKELEAQILGKLPDSLEAELYKRKTYWRYCERQYQVERFKLGAVDRLKVDEWEEKKINAQKSYQNYMDELENSQETYVQIKRTTRQITIKEIQKNLLANEQALIEYFVGESFLYVFVIGKQAVHFLQLNKPNELEIWVADLLTSISDPDLKQTHQYIQNSTNLYNSLILPIIEAGINLPSRLKIVPDGILSYIPFGALMYDLPPAQKTNFKAYPYLIKNHVISYAYSARLLAQLRQLLPPQRSARPFLGIAPVFENSHRFLHLTKSENEVEFLRRQWKGEILLGKEANKANFIRTAKDYNILHIYSHAVANAQSPHMSYIGLYEQTGTPADDLYLADIYAMKLKADMVVLSACETQTGALQKGEGLMSLARGFTYAGCRSIVATRWQVNETSTDKVMRTFYQELAEEASKDVALNKAKLHYLLKDEQTDKLLAHPYFWAAYAPIGDMRAISSSISWIRLVGTAFGFICLLGIIYGLMQGRKRPQFV